VQLRREDAERIARDGGEPAGELVLLLFGRVAELDERLEKLERRLGQNSVNSSLPPSSDRGQGLKRPARKRSERKQGGQLGHEGSSRKLIDDPDETVAVRLDACRKCGHDLTVQGRVVGRPARQQVIDLPESAVVMTEHQLLKVACPACGTHTRAELPAGVERGALGPRLRATVVMLAAMLMSRRATALMLADMFGAKLSTGSVEKILKDVSASLAKPWEAIKRAVQAGAVAHADKTSWRRAGQRMWL
jgi:transposase